jgi:hypothetical protein
MLRGVRCVIALVLVSGACSGRSASDSDDNPSAGAGGVSAQPMGGKGAGTSGGRDVQQQAGSAPTGGRGSSGASGTATFGGTTAPSGGVGGDTSPAAGMAGSLSGGGAGVSGSPGTSGRGGATAGAGGVNAGGVNAGGVNAGGVNAGSGMGGASAGKGGASAGAGGGPIRVVPRPAPENGGSGLCGCDRTEECVSLQGMGGNGRPVYGCFTVPDGCPRSDFNCQCFTPCREGEECTYAPGSGQYGCRAR